MEIENFTAHRIKCTNELRNIKMHRGRLAKENLSLKDENIQLKAKLQHETAYEDLERERELSFDVSVTMSRRPKEPTNSKKPTS